MAGRGPAAKPADQRRRRNVPARGEWVDVPPLGKPVLPVADKRWSPRVKRLWEAWRADPVSGVWSVSDRAAAWELAEQFVELAANEQRLRMDGLGLTPKGRRDLRYRYGDDPHAVVEREGVGQVRRLKVVADD